MNFRKKPVVIEAVRWTGANVDEVLGFILAKGSVRRDGATSSVLFIDTLEGTMRADAGDWIIRGIKGEFYPCKPDIFEATYEPAVAPPVVPVVESTWRTVNGARCENCGNVLTAHYQQMYCNHPVVQVVASQVEQDYKALYFELLYQVGNKHSGESRHQTALRYIREREAPSNIANSKSAAEPPA